MVLLSGYTFLMVFIGLAVKNIDFVYIMFKKA